MGAIPCGAVALVAVLALACHERPALGITPLDELERLAFVPASPCRLDGYVGVDADLSL
jgi:hypothetical protein